MLYCKKHEVELKSIMRMSGLSAGQTFCLAGHLASLERHNGVKFLIGVLVQRVNALTSGNDPFSFRGKYWAGPFRAVSQLARRGRRGLDKAIICLRFHGLFHAAHATEKAYRLVALELISPKDYSADVPLIYPEIFKERFQGIHHDNDSDYPMSARRTPLGKKNVPEFMVLPVDYIRSMDHFPSHVVQHYNYYKRLIGEGIPSLWHYLSIIEIRSRIFTGRKLHRSFRGFCTIAAPLDVAGRVTILNCDGSLKERLVANANRVLQLACSPVHNYAMEFLREHPSSFVHDQLGGVEWIRSKLDLGWIFSSIDLKKASDNIPLGLQIRFLKKMVPSLTEPLDVFYEVSRMVFLTPYKDTTVSWSCGSPMGVKGSFGLFTVFIMSILEYQGAHGAYAIVGDDIVVKSDFTALVLNSLNYYGIPISKQKSLFNHFRFAEFCGKIIDKFGPFKANKGSQYDLTTNPTGLLRLYGRRALRFLPTKLSRESVTALVHFHYLEKKGYLEALRVLLAKAEEPDTSVKFGGFSYEQLIRLVPEAFLEDDSQEFLSRDPKGLTSSEHSFRQILLWGLTNKALAMFDNRPKELISAWKFKVRDPSQAYTIMIDGGVVTGLSESESYYEQEPLSLRHSSVSPRRDLYDVVQKEVSFKEEKDDPGALRRRFERDIVPWKALRKIARYGHRFLLRLPAQSFQVFTKIRKYISQKP